MPALEQVGRDSRDKDKQERDRDKLEAQSRIMRRTYSKQQEKNGHQQRCRVSEIACAAPARPDGQAERKCQRQRRTALSELRGHSFIGQRREQCASGNSQKRSVAHSLAERTCMKKIRREQN